MKKLLLFPLLLFAFSVSAQEVIAVQDQGTTFSVILSTIAMQNIPYNVDNYRLTYTTVDAFGQPDTASGLLCIPQQPDLVFPLLVYNHGTIDRDEDAISNTGVFERFLPQAIAGSGFIAVAPDYIGFGASNGPHPYLHARSEATAGRDLVIAARAWLDEQAIARNDQLFVTGYSQGGHASMALQKLLDTEGQISVTAAAHLSGVYAIQPPPVEVLAIANPDPVTLRFFLNQVIAYEYVYELYGGVNTLFVEPYRTTVNAFVADEIDLVELSQAIADSIVADETILGAIFIEQFVTDLLDMDAALLAAYTENTVYDFSPEEPTLIYACPGDEVVDPANAQTAFVTLSTQGADTVELMFGPTATHLECAPPAALAARDFFQRFANVYPVSLGEPTDRPRLRLAPNPVAAGGELTFTGITTSRPYVVYDLSGRELSTGDTAADGTLRLPGHLSRGLHVIRVGLADGTSVVRRFTVR